MSCDAELKEALWRTRRDRALLDRRKVINIFDKLVHEQQQTVLACAEVLLQTGELDVPTLSQRAGAKPRAKDMVHARINERVRPNGESLHR